MTLNSNYTKHIEGVDCPQESQHTRAPRGYGAFQAWADEKSKTHKQVRCGACGRWAIWVPKPTAKELEQQRDPL